MSYPDVVIACIEAFRAIEANEDNNMKDYSLVVD